MDRLIRIRAGGSSVFPDSCHAVEGIYEVFNLSSVRKQNFLLPSGCMRHIHAPGALGISSGLRRAQVGEGLLGDLGLPMVSS